MNDPTSPNTKGKGCREVKNHRKAPRLDASAIPFLKSINEVGGPEVRLINISRHGALIESQVRLTTGSSICLRLVTAEKAYFLKGRVLRYRVSSLAAGVLCYQSAIEFDEDFTILPENTEIEEIREEKKVELPADNSDSATTTSNLDSSAEADEDPKVVTVNTSDLDEDSKLWESLKINNWLST